MFCVHIPRNVKCVMSCEVKYSGGLEITYKCRMTGNFLKVQDSLRSLRITCECRKVFCGFRVSRYEARIFLRAYSPKCEACVLRPARVKA